jgi:hypothetical protein
MPIWQFVMAGPDLAVRPHFLKTSERRSRPDWKSGLGLIRIGLPPVAHEPKISEPEQQHNGRNRHPVLKMDAENRKAVHKPLSESGPHEKLF